MLSIYNYTESGKFLRDSWKEKKKRNPAFSMSAWAKQLGLENSSPLSLAFKGKRSLPKKYLPDVVRTLGLSSEEGTYLEMLIDLSKAKSPQQKMYYTSRLKEISPAQSFNNTTVEAYKYLSDPLHTTILEMTDLKAFRFDARWIKNKLRVDFTLEEVQEAMDRLIELGLLTKNQVTNKTKKTHKNLTSENDIADLATKTYHQKISALAAEQIFIQALLEREYGSYAFNMKKESIPVAKKLIREFLDEFFRQVEAASEEASDTYQFNLQLFNMTK